MDENKKDLVQLRLQCVQEAVKLIGEPKFIMDENGKTVKEHEDIVKVSEKIFNFIMNY